MNFVRLGEGIDWAPPPDPEPDVPSERHLETVAELRALKAEIATLRAPRVRRVERDENDNITRVVEEVEN